MWTAELQRAAGLQLVLHLHCCGAQPHLPVRVLEYECPFVQLDATQAREHRAGKERQP